MVNTYTQIYTLTHSHTHTHTHTHTLTGYAAAPNGFMNGVGDDHEAQLEEDAYPEDGPLYSGTHSLRRIRNTSAPKMPVVSPYLYILRYTIVIHTTLYHTYTYYTIPYLYYTILIHTILYHTYTLFICL